MSDLQAQLVTVDGKNTEQLKREIKELRSQLRSESDSVAKLSKSIQSLKQVSSLSQSDIESGCSV